jgi:hypothetical protein
MPAYTVLVSKETSSPKLELGWLIGKRAAGPDVEPLLPGLIAAYRQRNGANVSLNLASLERVQLISSTELHRFFANGGAEGYSRLWKEFPAASALVSFSLPGYNQDGTLALIYANIGRGPFDIQGKVLILKRLSQEKWGVIKIFIIAES